MFLSVYHFEGDPDQLQGGHARMLAMIPPTAIHLHFGVARPDGLDVYDACPTREAFEAFTGGPDFPALLAAVDLPLPRIEPLGLVERLRLAP